MSTEYWLDIYGDVQISHKLFIGKTNFEVLLEVMYNNQYGPSDFSDLNYELREDYQTDQVLVSDTLDMDVFSPPRQDWLSGTDAYLRGK